MGRDASRVQGSGHARREEWWGLGQFMKGYVTRYADGLDAEYKEKKGKDDYQILLWATGRTGLLSTDLEEPGDEQIYELENWPSTAGFCCCWANILQSKLITLI